VICVFTARATGIIMPLGFVGLGLTLAGFR